MDKNNDYIISGGPEGKARLNVLSEVLRPYTGSMLVQQGVTAGTSLLDVGCGGGNVVEMVAEMVGDNGTVTGIDFDETILELDRRDAAGKRNVTYRALNAYDIDYKDAFDVAYARFLLSHLKAPIDVLRKMKESVEPEGKIIIEDVQFNGHFCYPANGAFDEYVRLYTLAAMHNGADANIGPTLPKLFDEAGIAEVGFDVIQPSFTTGTGKWMAYITLDKIKQTLVEQGIANAETISEILRELEAFTKDERSIISLPRIFRVWGIKK